MAESGDPPVKSGLLTEVLFLGALSKTLAVGEHVGKRLRPILKSVS